MTTTVLQRNLQSIRNQVEQALHTLPWSDTKMTGLRLRIEEAIEVTYEVEMARGPAAEVRKPAFLHPEDERWLPPATSWICGAR